MWISSWMAGRTTAGCLVNKGQRSRSVGVAVMCASKFQQSVGFTVLPGTPCKIRGLR